MEESTVPEIIFEYIYPVFAFMSVSVVLHLTYLIKTSGMYFGTHPLQVEP